ncbi:hypothetical protein C0J52_05945 [Blattella germanica]|nr:hypothetical protein C0J52_05945 [Blattella germanica]
MSRRPSYSSRETTVRKFNSINKVDFNNYKKQIQPSLNYSEVISSNKNEQRDSFIVQFMYLKMASCWCTI